MFIYTIIIDESNKIISSMSRKAKLEIFDDAGPYVKDMVQNAYDNLKKSVRDMLLPVPLSESRHDRFFHVPLLNKNGDPPFFSEAVKVEWSRALLLQVNETENNLETLIVNFNHTHLSLGWHFWF